MDKKCVVCCFWKSDADINTSSMGDCRRQPPVLLIKTENGHSHHMMTPPYSTHAFAAYRIITVSEFPRTNWDCWCGEFKQKEEKK